MKRKKKLLLWALAILIVGGVASYFGAKAILNQRIEHWGNEGIAASAAGDHEPAADLLARYLRRRPDRIDALSAYVKSRELAVLPNGQHLAETIVGLKMLVGIDPNRIEDRRHLLELYAKLGRRPEALDTADAILKYDNGKYKNDLKTLELKTSVLTGFTRYREALGVADTWTTLDPNNLQAHMARITLRAFLKQPADVIFADAKKLRDAHPGDPRFEFLQGFAAMQLQDQTLVTEQEKLATQWFKTAAAHPDLSDELTKLIVTQFNKLGLSNDSLELLQTRVEKGAGAEIRYALARRLWQRQAWDKVIALLSDLDLIKPETDPTLIAFKALSFARIGKPQDGKPYRDALGAKKHPGARAWTLILNRLIDNAQVDNKQLVKECQDALALDPQNSFLSYYLGDATARLGETDLSIEAWTRSAGENSTWSEPAVRLVEALLQAGKAEQAIYVANFAQHRNPNASVAVALARAYAAGIESGVVAAERTDDLLKFVTEIQAKLPREERSLVLQIQLSAQKGRKEQAATLTRAALAMTPPVSEQVFLNLSALSRKYKLGLEADCFAACEKAHGMTPRLAYVEAIDRSISTNPEEGLKKLEELAQRSGKSQEMMWRLMHAQYLDIAANPDAKAEWMSLGESFPNDLTVQEAAASARSVRGEWTFMFATIDRLQKLTGDKGLVWRLTKARLLVESPRTAEDSEKGSVLLTQIIQEFQELSEPHVLLARALWQMKRYDGAVEHLSIASKLEPTSIPIALQLAAMLQSRGDYERVRLELDRLTPHLHSPEQRRQAAVLMSQQGNIDGAIKLLEDIKKETGQGDLFLASLYRNRGQINKAQEILTSLLDKPNPEIIFFATSFYVSQGRNSNAENALKMLDGLKLAPGVKEFAWAGYYVQIHNIEEAAKHYQAATQQAPANVIGWELLANCQIGLGKSDQAQQTIKQGLLATPSDPGLQIIDQRFDLLRECALDSELQPLVGAVIRNPQGSSLMLELLEKLAESHRSHDNEKLATALQQFAERNPTFLQAHIQLAQCYWQMGRQRDALSIAQRIVAAFPNNPDPAQFAVQLYAAAGAWQEMLAAAEVWKKRSDAGPMGPDLEIARAQMGMKRYDVAATQLQPYVATATAQPDRYADLLSKYCVALANSGQAQKAADILWPLAEKEIAFRARWIQIAVELLDPQAAVNWIDRGAGIVPADSLQERLMLAECYDSLGRRDKNEMLIQRSTDLFKEITANPKVDAVSLLSAGAQAERSADSTAGTQAERSAALKAAEAYYRRAVAMDPKDPSMWITQNNLAMMVANGGGNMTEAIAFAAAAVKSQPQMATLYDTLAQVQAKAGDFKSAIDSINTAIHLEPDNSKWRVRLAQYYLDAGNQVEAGKTIAAIYSSNLDVTRLPPNVKQQLDAIGRKIKGQKLP